MLSRTRRRWLALAAGCSLSMPLEAAAQDDAAAAPAIDSPLAVEPRTPEELFRAVLFTLQIDRPDVARKYLDAFLAGAPDDALLLQLRDEHGTATLMQLVRVKELQPASQQLLNRVRQAALARISDPAVVDGLIDRLTGAPRERGPALRELQHVGPHAVGHLLRRVQSLEAPISPELAIETIVSLGSDARAPLQGAIQTAPDVVRSLAIDALGQLGDASAALDLWAPAFSPRSAPGIQAAARRGLARLLTGDVRRTGEVHPFRAVDDLLARVRKLQSGDYEHEPGDDGLVSVWTWRVDAEALAESRVSSEHASLFLAEQYARQAVELAGDRTDPPEVLLAILMARDVEQAGWSQPVPEGPGTAHNLALALGPDVAEAVLARGLKDHNVGAALTALRVLEQTGSRARLNAASGGASPVLLALDSPEPRIQFAAAETILQWDPETSFPAARRVVDILSRALSGDAIPDGVVIDPNARRGSIIADQLQALGYEPRVAGTGQEGFLSAAESGDAAIALVHLNAIRWELSQTIANLRADARTARLPIAIYGPAGMQDRAAHLTAAYPGVTYVEEPNDSQEMARQLRPFLKSLSPPALTEDARRRQKLRAAAWLEHIALGQRTTIYDLAPAAEAALTALNDPELSRAAAVIVGSIPRPEAQERLLIAALNSGGDAPQRTTAARQLGLHLQRYGLLLSNEDVARLRNAAEDELDPTVQTALTAAIGSLQPDRQVVRERLLDAPAATAPLP